MDWEFHNARFIVDQAPELPHNFMTNGPWSGHRRFAYDLVRFAQPRIFVELGTHYGTSFFSFCQAVRDGHLPTHCYAVDIWQGDAHSGYYGEHVFQTVHDVTVREFPTIGNLLRSDFDTACTQFPDGSIDLLHIDGYHTYEAALHDFTTWYPKLADYGIVLFHDISVRYGDFGVYRLWEQLTTLPHLEFSHSNGLGVLFPKGCTPAIQAVLEQKSVITAYYTTNE